MAEKSPVVRPAGFIQSVAMRILLGAEKQEFWIHKDLIELKSEFFKGCSRGSFLETTTNTMELPEDSAEAFGVIAHWLYFDYVESGNDSNHAKKLIEAYVLADKLIMPSCQNDIIDEIVQYYSKQLVQVDDLEVLAAMQVGGENKVYQFFVDQYSWSLQHEPQEYFEKTEGGSTVGSGVLQEAYRDFLEQHGDFASQVIGHIFRDMHQNPDSEQRCDPARDIKHPCKYHVHSDGDKPCQSKSKESE